MFPCHHDIVDTVPERDVYPTLDEYETIVDGLGALPGVAVRQVGASRAGNPIRCLEVGEGTLHAVIVGVAHPEELVGTLVVERLAQTQLAALLCALEAVRERHRPARPRLGRPLSPASR